MNRVIGRSIGLVLAVVACKGDPTGDLRNGIDHLIATPSAIFLSRGVTTNVLIEAVDDQGNREGTKFTLEQVSPLIDVQVDSTFGRYVNNDGDLVFPDKPTRLRFAVSPISLVGDASFVVRASGREITVPVRLVPDSVSVTFSNDAPAVGDTVTITAPAPFILRPNATIDAGGLRAIAIDQTGNTVRVVPIPGGTAGPVTVNGLALDYSTGLNLSLPSSATFTVPAGLAGTGALATAPTITIPAAGSTSLFIDAGARQDVAECDDDHGAPCRVYKLNLATARTFDVSATWEGTSDLGLDFYNSAGTHIGGGCDGHGNGAGGQPEECTKTLGPGTFYITVVDFGPLYDPAEAEPAWIRLDLTGH